MTIFELYLITCCDSVRVAFFVLAFFFFLCTISSVGAVETEASKVQAKLFLFITVLSIAVVTLIPSSRRAAYIFSAPLTVQSNNKALQVLSEQYINEIKLKELQKDY